jgi:K+-sensing histidine kinase KdpD
MIRKTPKTVGNLVIRLSWGMVLSLVLTWIAYHLHFDLSAATSVHLFLVIAIALRWGFPEAGLISFVSVVCLDYFFTNPLFAFYMSDTREWVALIAFEGVAMLVSRLSNQIRRHADESERHRLRLQKLYELSQSILFLHGNGPIDQSLIEMTKTTVAVALERARSFMAESSAEASRHSEQLRAAVLDGLAHAFRTPLTTIRSSSSGLLAMNSLSGRELKLVTLIDHHANHLSDLTTHLLRMARLDNADLKPRRIQVDILQVIQDSVTACARELEGHQTNICTALSRNVARADAQLLK